MTSGRVKKSVPSDPRAVVWKVETECLKIQWKIIQAMMGERGAGEMGVQGHKRNKMSCRDVFTYTMKPKKRRQGLGPRRALVQQVLVSEVGQAGVWQYG